jgi:hypothetical protein
MAVSLSSVAPRLSSASALCSNHGTYLGKPLSFFQKSFTTSGRIMKTKFSLFALFAALAVFSNGCAGWVGPNGLGQRVLVACKISPDQQAAANKVSNEYFSQVASGKKARPSRRYVAVQTLDPNPKQQAKYVQAKAAAQKKAESNGQSLGADWVEPSHLHCIMIFDVVTHESVGTNCYVVASLPDLGAVNSYDTFPAEFVASSAQFVSP